MEVNGTGYHQFYASSKILSFISIASFFKVPALAAFSLPYAAFFYLKILILMKIYFWREAIVQSTTLIKLLNFVSLSSSVRPRINWGEIGLGSSSSGSLFKVIIWMIPLITLIFYSNSDICSLFPLVWAIYSIASLYSFSLWWALISNSAKC